MLLLIGLGNPGAEYEHTRHSVGFLVINELAKRQKIDLRFKRALEAEIAEGAILEKRVILCKPQTFMNVSGRAMQKIRKKYPVNAENILVIYDDADLPFGSVRMKTGGSAAGHRGMQSILDQFPSGTSIARVRVGIGRPDHPDVPLEEFVLQRWTQKEEKELPSLIGKSLELVEVYAR